MPSLVHGQPISAEEIERIISREFSPETFVLLCNSVAWASAGKKFSSLPSFTERIYVPDGGKDAEWTVGIESSEQVSSAFLSSGWNVYQYKHRDVSARNRAEIISKLKADLKGALNELINRHKRQPVRYVLFVNLHLTLDEQNELKAKIKEGYNGFELTTVELVEAAFLASSLNNLPHLRSSFFATSQFMTWQKAWLEHENQKIYGANIALTGRDERLNGLRDLIDASEIRAVVISGVKDVGKTRLVLEATKHRSLEVIVSVSRQIEAGDLRHLESPSFRGIIVVEDPDSSKIKDLINQALAHSSLKLIITVPTSENSPAINFGLDDRVKSIQLSSLSEEESRGLLRASKSELDYAMESWIIKQAGGNPGILLQAAKRGSTLRQDHGNFSEQIAKALVQEVREQNGNEAIDILRLLSLLEFVGIEGKASREVKTLWKWFRPNAFFNKAKVDQAIQSLTQSGFVLIRGVYVEVTPPLLANYLAASMLQDERSAFFALFADLAQEGRSRLIQRLQGLNPEKMSWFWDELFSQNGLLRDLSTAIFNKEIFYLAACANPDRTIDLLHKELKHTTLNQRKSLPHIKQSNLVWVIEELIFRNRTSVRALHCLGLIAETEITNHNSAAVTNFCQCFRPLHSQVPISLEYRLELLKSFLSPTRSTDESHLLVVEVIKTVLDRGGYHFLREGKGNKPFDSMPQMTWGDVWKYQEDLFLQLVELAQSKRPQVGKAAIQAFPRAIAEFAMLQFCPGTAIAAFQKAIDWVTSRQSSLSISKLADALHTVYDFYNRREDKFQPETKLEVEKFLQDINSLINSFNTAKFSVRLKRWAGNWTRSHNEYESDEHGNHVYRNEQEAQALAEEVISNPLLLTDDLLEWLCSAEAKEKYNFCYWLGRLDVEHRWLVKIEQIGARHDGIDVFAAYIGGLGQNDRQYISNYLDKMSQAGEVTPEAVVAATQRLGGDLQGVKRVVKLIQDKRVDPRFVEYVLEWGKWIEPLSSDEYLCLLEAIAGSDLRNAAVVVKFFFTWLHLDKKVEEKLADFAWRCLETSDTEYHDYYFDQLAFHLVKTDIEKGFELLEKLVLKQITSYQCWSPINNHDSTAFWNYLYDCDHRRAIDIPLRIAVQNPERSFSITSHLQGIIDRERDVDALVDFVKASEVQAKVVCDLLCIRSSTFWQVAFEIITHYPDSQEIKDYLSHLVVEPNPLQSRLEYLTNGLGSVEQALKEKHPPFAARLWLDELRSYLQIKIEQEKSSSEIDSSAALNSLQLSESLDSEKVWAIRRLLNDGEIEKIRQLLSQDDLLHLLAMPDLLESERKNLQNLLELDITQLSLKKSSFDSVNITSVEKLILMSNQSPIFNQQHATIGVNYAAEGSTQKFTQNIAATEQNFEILLADFEQFINDLQQRYPSVTDKTAIQIIDAEVEEIRQKHPIRWQNFLNLKRLWNGGKKAAFKVGEHYAEQNPLGKGAIAFLEGVME
ncbi:MAG: hypothetical protein MUC48_14550 [Leptolyngbya sp. Prado105]|jgi:hypothetical protein|nr:hypothetical protein [Leptolyngbya sp. Prado105]